MKFRVEMTKVINQSFIYYSFLSILVICTIFSFVYLNKSHVKTESADPTYSYIESELVDRIAYNESEIERLLAEGKDLSTMWANRLKRANIYYEYLLENGVPYGSYSIYESVDSSLIDNSYSFFRIYLSFLLVVFIIFSLILSFYVFSADFFEKRYKMIYGKGMRMKTYDTKGKVFILIIFVFWTFFFVLGIMMSLFFSGIDQILLTIINGNVFSMTFPIFCIIMYCFTTLFILTLSCMIYYIKTISLNPYISIVFGVLFISLFLGIALLTKNHIVYVLLCCSISIFSYCNVLELIFSDVIRTLICLLIIVMSRVFFSKRSLNI